MKSIRFFLFAVLLTASHAASAETVDGNGALALAALVGENSPLVSAPEKSVLAKLLDGQTSVSFPAGQTISVVTAKLTCRASNVDITSHSCELAFGSKNVPLAGRRAHELFATLAEVGIPPDGAAGSVFEAIAKLDCKIDPNEVKQASGGGTHCQYALPD